MTFKKLFFYLAALCAAVNAAHAARLTGIVVDPSNQPIPGARVAAVTGPGVITVEIAGDDGTFDIYVSPLYEYVQLRVTADGFEPATAPMAASRIQLSPAPRSDSIRSVASAINSPAAAQGSGLGLVTSLEVRERNESQAADLLRESPGLVFAQAGGRGAADSLFVRGGDPAYNLVLLDGIPVNGVHTGGLFDFAHIAADAIEEIDVARGPQSSVYGSYAMGAVIDFIPRSADDGPALDVVAEGGTHAENRFSIGGSGTIPGTWVKNLGVAGSLSSLNANGPVANSGYRNDDALLSITHPWRTQSLYAFGNFDSDRAGEPGPWGSNPLGYFAGIDHLASARDNTSTYGAHYRDDLTETVRLDVLAGFFLNNSGYRYSGGYLSNKDLRGHGDGRVTWAISRHWIMAGGYAFDREETRNTGITDSTGTPFLLRRDDEGVYLESRIVFGKLFVNAGLREEVYRTPAIPGDSALSPPRPTDPARTDTRLNPKVSAGWLFQPTLRVHGSYGTGIRPPGALDLAFTNNPALKPERSESYDMGVEEEFLKGRLSLDATWFHNRYKDLIVPLGGPLATLSRYYTDNISNALAQGTEIAARFRPLSWVSLSGSYTWLDTEVLSLDGSGGLSQQYFTVGQPLLRRPKQSGSGIATFHYGNLDANVTGYFRGATLEAEPNIGVAGGIYRNPGYKTFGLNVNYRVRGNLTVYANLRNALDARYEEVYGYPSPLLNVVAGVKWALARAR